MSTSIEEAQRRLGEGRYRLIRQLGKGAMGTVYEAEHAGLGRPCALKLLNTAIADPSVVKRFDREARVLARLKHPGIVNILDYGVSSDGLPFLVTELLVGKPLDEVLKQRGPLSADEVHRVAREVLSALDHTHEQGIVHRDLKLANLFLEDSGRVRVLDYGVAKLTETVTGVRALTKTGQTVGTPRYLAPEQLIAGRSVDHRADIWAMGVVLYRLLSGSYPFPQPTVSALLFAIATEPPAPLSAGKRKIDPALAACVMRALEKEPSARYQTALDFSGALFETSAEYAMLTRRLGLPPPGVAEAAPEATAAMPRPAEVVSTVLVAPEAAGPSPGAAPMGPRSGIRPSRVDDAERSAIHSTTVHDERQPSAAFARALDRELLFTAVFSMLVAMLADLLVRGW